MISQYEDGVLTDWTLTISGEGEMPDFGGAGYPVCPWENEKQKIKKVIIEEGVTNIGKSAFRGCSELAEVHISKTVKKIGDSAFQAVLPLRKLIFLTASILWDRSHLLDAQDLRRFIPIGRIRMKSTLDYSYFMSMGIPGPRIE